MIVVGKGKLRNDGSIQPLDVKAGDTIFVGRYSGTDVKCECEDQIIMGEDEIVGVIKTDK